MDHSMNMKFSNIDIEELPEIIQLLSANLLTDSLDIALHDLSVELVDYVEEEGKRGVDASHLIESMLSLVGPRFLECSELSETHKENPQLEYNYKVLTLTTMVLKLFSMCDFMKAS